MAQSAPLAAQRLIPSLASKPPEEPVVDGVERRAVRIAAFSVALEEITITFRDVRFS
jgi:hypothetical protein